MYSRPRDITEQGIIQGVPCIWPAILFDDFEGAFPWIASGTGADFTADRVASAALYGNYGLRLKTKTTDPSIDDQVSVTRLLFLKPSAILRLQIACHSSIAAGNALIKIMPTMARADTKHYGHVYIDILNSRAGYGIGSNGAETIVYPTGWDIYTTSPTWNFIDLRINRLTSTWHSLAINQYHIDLAGVPLHPAAPGTNPFLGITLRVIAQANAIASAYIDHLLITAEEP